MGNLFRGDIYRILRGKALYITLAALLVYNMLMLTAGFSIELATAYLPEEARGEAITSEFISQTRSVGIRALQVLATSMEGFVFFLLSAVIFVAGASFTHKTVKNDLAWGVSRTKLYFSKLFLCFIVGALMLLFYIGAFMLISIIVHGVGDSAPIEYWLEFLPIFAAQLFMLLSLISVGVFLVFATRRTAIVNVAFIAFYLVLPSIAVGFVASNPSTVWLLDFDMLSNIRMLSNLPQLEAYEILRALGVGAFWLIASTIAGVALFRKADIK